MTTSIGGSIQTQALRITNANGTAFYLTANEQGSMQLSEVCLDPAHVPFLLKEAITNEYI